MNEYGEGWNVDDVVVDLNFWMEIVDRRRKWKYPASVAP